MGWRMWLWTRGDFLGGDLAGVLWETGVVILFVMHEGVEDYESSGMLERFWVLVIMLGVV